jgi:hypothetical protein
VPPATVTVPADVTGSSGSSSASVPVPSSVIVLVDWLNVRSAIVRTVSQAASVAMIIPGSVIVPRPR